MAVTIASTHCAYPYRRTDRQAELAWVADYVVRQFTFPKAVTHPTTNRAQCRATASIKTNVLPLHLSAIIIRVIIIINVRVNKAGVDNLF